MSNFRWSQRSRQSLSGIHPDLVAVCNRAIQITEQDFSVIEDHYDGLRGNAPWWLGFEFRAWTVKGMTDWVLPLLVTAAWMVW